MIFIPFLIENSQFSTQMYPIVKWYIRRKKYISVKRTAIQFGIESNECYKIKKKSHIVKKRELTVFLLISQRNNIKSVTFLIEWYTKTEFVFGSVSHASGERYRFNTSNTIQIKLLCARMKTETTVIEEQRIHHRIIKNKGK